MPRGRKKRNDSSEAPVDGDYRFDVLVDENGEIIDEKRLKKMDRRFAFLSSEDIPRKKIDGYRKVVRLGEGERGVKPLYDTGEPTDSGYTLGSLTLYEVPVDRKERADGRALALAAARTSAIYQDAKRAGVRVDEDRRAVRT